jgi:hypothetical protein
MDGLLRRGPMKPITLEQLLFILSELKEKHGGELLVYYDGWTEPAIHTAEYYKSVASGYARIFVR